jgi:hypothetical protein
MKQNWEIKYSGRGLQLEVFVDTKQKEADLLESVKTAARGPALNMCVAGLVRMNGENGGSYRITLILNTDEDMRVVGERCRVAVCEGSPEFHSCVTMGGELLPEETRSIFDKMTKLAEQAARADRRH